MTQMVVCLNTEEKIWGKRKMINIKQWKYDELRVIKQY